MKQTCIEGCQSDNEVFCSSGKGLAFFKIERGNYLSRTCKECTNDEYEILL
jgi:predicted nucleic-acid-binding Zn-ribbon protein